MLVCVARMGTSTGLSLSQLPGHKHSRLQQLARCVAREMQLTSAPASLRLWPASCLSDPWPDTERAACLQAHPRVVVPV